MRSQSKREGCSILVYEVHPWKRDTLGIKERACALCTTQRVYVLIKHAAYINPFDLIL